MATNPPAGYPRVTPYLMYEDPAAALDWLVGAFGFEERFRHVGDQGWIDRTLRHARAAGAVIRSEPSQKPYGTIQYSAVDPEGHLWLFSEQIREPEWRLERAG